jgi:SAM-dependent methyltransferase
LFINALSARLRRESGQVTTSLHGNLYLADFESRQIDLFNLMATRMPFVLLAARAANLLLASRIHADDRVTLLDIGMGTGRQEVELVRLLAAQGKFSVRLKVIGIEPSLESLKLAQSALTLAEKETGIPIEFVPVHRFIEDLSEQEWASLRSSRHEKLLINQAFALHHACRGTVDHIDAKQKVLHQIFELDPELLVLTEPDSDHQSPELVTRFRNAWRHFGLVFRTIDLLDLDSSDKTAMKAYFFGREIEDILSAPEDVRSERHESSRMWLLRLAQAGFKMSRESYAKIEVEKIALYPVKCNDRQTHLTLDLENQPVVGILAASARG